MAVGQQPDGGFPVFSDTESVAAVDSGEMPSASESDCGVSSWKHRVGHCDLGFADLRGVEVANVAGQEDQFFGHIPAGWTVSLRRFPSRAGIS